MKFNTDIEETYKPGDLIYSDLLDGYFMVIELKRLGNKTMNWYEWKVLCKSQFYSCTTLSPQKRKMEEIIYQDLHGFTRFTWKTVTFPIS